MKSGHLLSKIKSFLNFRDLVDRGWKLSRNKKRVITPTGAKIILNTEAAEILLFGSVAVILLNYKMSGYENVVAYEESGNLLWKIKSFRPENYGSLYTSIGTGERLLKDLGHEPNLDPYAREIIEKGNVVWLYDAAGYGVYADAKTGNILLTEFIK